MRRTSIWTPLSVIISGIILIALMVAPQRGAAQDEDATATPTAYPTGTFIAGQTQTATALTATAYSAPNRTPGVRTPGTGGRTPTATTRTPTVGTPGPTAAGGPTRTPTGTPGGANTGGTAVTTTPTPTPTGDATSSTPTPTPQGDVLTCVPGETVTISGQGPANAGFLLYFSQRIVSGATVRADGTFAIGLRVGNEAPGRYLVEVRERGNRRLLKAVTCDVPAVTPTVIPVR